MFQFGTSFSVQFFPTRFQMQMRSDDPMVKNYQTKNHYHFHECARYTFPLFYGMLHLKQNEKQNEKQNDTERIKKFEFVKMNLDADIIDIQHANAESGHV